ncbi:MAG TPA: AraC family transcriptional regulator [Kofleriaceae bacterium]
MSATILRRFPLQRGDDALAFYRQFWSTSMVIHATARRVSYEEHTAPLSIKCAFGGVESYLVDHARMTVDDSTYLVLNHGRPYASWIEGPRDVESLAVFFAPGFVANVLRDRIRDDDRLLDDPRGKAEPCAFYERRMPHDRSVSPYLRRLRAPARDALWLDEQLHGLASALLRVHRRNLREARRLPAVRASTRAELYRRLLRARDAIESDPHARHRLDELARIACLAPHHFLRRFTDAFGTSPYQYVLAARRRKTQFSPA